MDKPARTAQRPGPAVRWTATPTQTAADEELLTPVLPVNLLTWLHVCLKQKSNLSEW